MSCIRVLVLGLSLSACALAQAPVPNYFTTTAAGFVPPVANPIAAKQFLGGVSAVAYDAKGNLYYANATQVWRLNADGTDTLIAGIPVPNPQNSGDGGPALNASMTGIFALSFDAAGNLYIAHNSLTEIAGNQVVREVTLDQNITTLLTIPTFVSGMAVDGPGNIYVEQGTETDVGCELVVSGEIVEYSTSGKTSTLLSNVDGVTRVGVGGGYLYAADNDTIDQLNLQTGAMQAFNVPMGGTGAGVEFVVSGLAAGPDGTVYVGTASDVWKMGSGGGAFLVAAGDGVTGYSGDGGLATQAQVTVDSLAVNPVTEDVAIGSSVVRVVTKSTGDIQTVAGAPPSAGDGGPAVLAQFATVVGGQTQALASDGAGNLYLFDKAGIRIRKISPDGIITTVAGNGEAGDSGDGGKAIEAAIVSSYGGVAADSQGNVYFINDGPYNSSNQGNSYTVRKVDTSGNITTVAGGGTAAVSSGVPAQSVALVSINAAATILGQVVNAPDYLAADPAGDIYICYNLQILKVDPSENLTVIAGVAGQSGHTGDGKRAAIGPISTCEGIAGDAAGNVYFNDNYALRKINTEGILSTVAGNQTASFGSLQLEAGVATDIPIGPSIDTVVDAAGNLYFWVDTSQIVMVDPSGNLTPITAPPPPSTSATLTPIAGGDGGDSLQTSFAFIDGIALGPSVNGAPPSIYVVDTGVYVRQLAPYNPASPPPFVSSGGVVGAGGSFPAVAAASPDGVETIFGANFVAAAEQHTLQASDLVNGKIPTNLAGVCVSFGGTPAALFGVYPKQLNVQVPPLPPGPVTVQVTANCGESGAVASNLGGVIVQSASPEFFSFAPDPVAGKNPVAAINALTYGYVGAPGLLTGATFTPAKPGEIVEAYGTGWGSTNPAFGVGVIPGVAAPLAQPYTVTFGGVELPPSAIIYAGASPCCAGEYQLDFTVPAGTPDGNQALVITVGGVSSPPQAFLDVQQ